MLITARANPGMGEDTRVRIVTKYSVNFSRSSQRSTGYLEKHRGHFTISGNHLQEACGDATKSSLVTSAARGLAMGV